MRNSHRFPHVLALALAIAASDGASAQGRLKPLPGGNPACGPLPRHLSSLPSSLRFEMPSDGNDLIELRLPRLADLDCRVMNFEFGSDYVFDLTRGDAAIEYLSKRARVELDGQLIAHSPMLHSERSRNPHYLEFVDAPRARQYWLFVGADGRPSRVEVRTYEGRFESSEKIAVISFK